MVLSAWLPGLTLRCPSGKVLPFCKFYEFKRVIRQNSLQACSDRVIDVLCSVFLKEFALCHYPVKPSLKYIMAMTMSNTEQCTKIAAVAL